MSHQMSPLEMSQHEVNVTRRIRTEEYARTINPKEAIKDPSFSWRSDIINTKLYCSCRDCIKFCCYNKPIICIDPYLIDMRYNHWIYQGLIDASDRENNNTELKEKRT